MMSTAGEFYAALLDETKALEEEEAEQNQHQHAGAGNSRGRGGKTLISASPGGIGHSSPAGSQHQDHQQEQASLLLADPLLAERLLTLVSCDDDIIQLASTVPLCSEVLFPLLLSYHDQALKEFLQGVLGRPIESVRVEALDRSILVRCSCASYIPGSASATLRATVAAAEEELVGGANKTPASDSAARSGEQSHDDPYCYKPKTILVVLKALSLLVPSATSLNTTMYEAFQLSCLNREYQAVKGTAKESAWRKARSLMSAMLFSPPNGGTPTDSANESNGPILGSAYPSDLSMVLDVDSIVSVSLLGNHPEHSFEGYSTMADLMGNAGTSNATTGSPTGSGPTTDRDNEAPPTCSIARQAEYVSQFAAPGFSHHGTAAASGSGRKATDPFDPWAALQFRFLSIPAALRLFKQQSQTELNDCLAKSAYCRWLWFLSFQTRVNFVKEIPSTLLSDKQLRRLWLTLAHVAQSNQLLSLSSSTPGGPTEQRVQQTTATPPRQQQQAGEGPPTIVTGASPLKTPSRTQLVEVTNATPLRVGTREVYRHVVEEILAARRQQSDSTRTTPVVTALSSSGGGQGGLLVNPSRTVALQCFAEDVAQFSESF